MGDRGGIGIAGGVVAGGTSARGRADVERDEVAGAEGGCYGDGDDVGGECWCEVDDGAEEMVGSALLTRWRSIETRRWHRGEILVVVVELGKNREKYRVLIMRIIRIPPKL